MKTLFLIILDTEYGPDSLSYVTRELAENVYNRYKLLNKQAWLMRFDDGQTSLLDYYNRTDEYGEGKDTNQ